MFKTKLLNSFLKDLAQKHQTNNQINLFTHPKLSQFIVYTCIDLKFLSL